MVSRLPPDISISQVDNRTMVVNIVEMIIVGDGIIGGSTPVQVQTQIAPPVRPYQLARGYPNARSVDITIGTDPRSVPMWINTFTRIQAVAFKPPYNVPIHWSTVTNTSKTVTLRMNGNDMDPNAYDIELDIQRVYLFTSFQRVGTLLE